MVVLIASSKKCFDRSFPLSMHLWLLHDRKTKPRACEDSKDDAKVKNESKNKKWKPFAGLFLDMIGGLQDDEALELSRACGKGRNLNTLIFFDEGAKG